MKREVIGWIIIAVSEFLIMFGVYCLALSGIFD